MAALLVTNASYIDAPCNLCKLFDMHVDVFASIFLLFVDQRHRVAAGEEIVRLQHG